MESKTLVPPRPLSAAAEPLLATKLFIPPVRTNSVTRTRLLARLNSEGERQLLLISAPPGYGKTTLAVEWLRRRKLPLTWLSLDEGDNDPVRFFTYLIAALQKLHENIGQAAQSLLALPQLPPAESMATVLVNDLATLEADPSTPRGSGFAIVLDDYHNIHTDYIHHTVEFLVEHAPTRLHLILGTRQDPPFSLARLRVRGQLTEIRADDLRFSREETAEWLNERIGLGLSDSAVSALQSRTEGWIAGLQLAAISLQGQDADRTRDFIQAFGGSNRYLIDYLLDEVMKRQCDDVHRFLCRTAILDRFNVPLCDAVTGRNDSKRVLEQLEQANLFLIPLDGRKEWYRYHHLFADFLRAELDPTEQNVIQQKAAQWHETNGFRAEAIEYALAAQDMEAAARWIEQVAGEMFERGELVTLSRWLEALPAQVVRENINLTGYRSWTLYFAGQLEAARQAAAASESHVQADTVGKGRLTALRGSVALLREEWSEGASLLGEALGQIGGADPFFRIMVLQGLAEAERHSGNAEAATRFFREGFEQGDKLGHPFAVVIALVGLIPNLNRQGRRREALAYCRRVLEQNVDARGQTLPIAGPLKVQLGMLQYAANELEPAHKHVLAGLAFYKELRLERIAIGDGEWTLVQILCAKGEFDAALALARETQRLAAISNQKRMACLMAAAVASVQLRMDDLASAARWAEEAKPALPIPPDPSYEFAYLVLVRVLLAQQRVEEALLLLGNLNESAKQDGRFGRLITVYILQALAHHAIGNREVAIDRLVAAVQLAAPEEYRRAFLDEGPIVAELLPGLVDRAPRFVESLLEAFEKEQGGKIDAEIGRHGDTERKAQVLASPRLPVTVSSLVEPLSERELEVLRLLADGKSNAEIAQALVVTVGTAKWHVHHVLAKLAVDNRTQAVARARELGLL